MEAAAISLAFVGVISLVVISAILKGWVLSILWGWFAVPTFHLPPIGTAQAIGVALVVSILTYQYVPSKDKDTWMPLATMMLNPFIALLVGWIVKGFT